MQKKGTGDNLSVIKKKTTSFIAEQFDGFLQQNYSLLSVFGHSSY